MKYVKLLDEQGRDIENPTPVECSLSFNQRDGKAYIWSERQDEGVLAELSNAWIEWVEVRGMKIIGVEDYLIDGKPAVRSMAWYVSFS